MKLNYLSRLTVLLVAVMMLGICSAGADSSVDLSDFTNDLIVHYDTVTEYTEAGYCSYCADEVVQEDIDWPASGYTCLYEQLKSLTASQAYDLMNANDGALHNVYFWAHQRHVEDAKDAAVICYGFDCTSMPIKQPGAEYHTDSTCPWHDEEYTQDVVGLNPVYGEDGSTIIGYRLILEDANGQLVLVATTDILDTETNYFYFKDVTTGLYVAYLHFDNDGNAWVIPLPSEKDLAEN